MSWRKSEIPIDNVFVFQAIHAFSNHIHISLTTPCASFAKTARLSEIKHPYGNFYANTHNAQASPTQCGECIGYAEKAHICLTK